MWHNLKNQFSSIKTVLNQFSKYRHVSLRKFKENTSALSTVVNAPASSKRYLRLVTAYSGLSKDSRKPINKKGIIGEDAWFITKQKLIDVIGVADGVGGWASVGVDPSKFSSNLMRQCKRFVEEQQDFFENRENINSVTPVKILSNSYTNLVERNDKNLVGSSTACIVLFDNLTNYLYAANLGDSGFLVVRNNQIIHRSIEQQHYFNCPFQLSILHDHQNNDDTVLDKPESAFVNQVKLVEGDLIILATDGLWDNLSDSSILHILTSLANTISKEDLEKTAQSIVKKAFELSRDQNYLSPFALSARQNNINITGGKPDDITILLARVCY